VCFRVFYDIPYTIYEYGDVRNCPEVSLDVTVVIFKIMRYLFSRSTFICHYERGPSPVYVRICIGRLVIQAVSQLKFSNQSGGKRAKKHKL